MKTQLELQDNTLHLYRYPVKSQHVSLQAWDSADELIFDYVSTEPQYLEKSKAILNDEFGALACLFKNNIKTWYSDSKVSHLALLNNWRMNYDSSPEFKIVRQLSDIDDSAQMVILKLPKNHQFLIEILITLRNKLASNTLVITGGKADKISKSTLQLFEQHLGETHTSLAKKKSRLIFSKVDKSVQTASKYPLTWLCDNSQLAISNFSNVFCANQLDIGARFLLHHLPNFQEKTVIDLGCGNGVLSAHALMHPLKKLYCVDESQMAIDSAHATLVNNFGDIDTEIFFVHSNCLEQVEEKQADVILCNPPFHQNNAITDHIAWQMFNDSKYALCKGGELRVVGNRHLGYDKKLKRVFGNCKLVAKNKKFVILSCIKR